MGNFFDVQGGGGRFSELPSPSNSRAAARFLRDSAGLAVEAVKQVEEHSVAYAVTSLTKLQGCCLWDHEDNLAEAELTTEQLALVGKGYMGPPLNLGTTVCADQVILLTSQRLIQRVDHKCEAQS
jgi:hypothetical protein